jgi:hypothetical protein
MLSLHESIVKGMLRRALLKGFALENIREAAAINPLASR